jgi:hypothetical protein
VSPPIPAPAAAPIPAASAPLDDSFDWHVLVVAPFGTGLQELPFAVHETLLFHDSGAGAAAPDEQECFGRDGPPPQFVGRVPEDFVLCFRRDRLVQIEAGVPAPDAAEFPFARLCDFWLRNARSVERSPQSCAGREGGMIFHAEVARAPGTGDPPEGAPPAWEVVIRMAPE